MTLVGLNSGLTTANETAITKEGSRRLRNDSESHTTSLLDNRERNYRQSSVIVCSLLLWRDAIKKVMTNVGIAFEVLEEGEKAPVAWRKVSGHLVFDVKMDFTRKVRWVLDGHKMPKPTGSTYAGVVSRESMRIAFTYAAHNGLDVCAADIWNAYLQAPSSQKDYVICGP